MAVIELSIASPKYAVVEQHNDYPQQVHGPFATKGEADRFAESLRRVTKGPGEGLRRDIFIRGYVFEMQEH